MVKPIVVGPFGVNCYLFFPSPRKCLIIDPGGDPDGIIKICASLEATPFGIAFTHGHLDHTSAVGHLLRHYDSVGEKPSLAIHSLDSMYLGDGAESFHRSNFAGLGFGNADELFGGRVFPLPAPDILLSEGDSLFDTDLIVVETPGHTEGSVSFHNPSEGIVFTGDTLFCQGIGRYDLPGSDGFKLMDSIRKKLLVLPPDTKVFPGHGPDTTIGSERANNPFL